MYYLGSSSVFQAKTKIDVGLTKIEVIGRSLLTFIASLLMIRLNLFKLLNVYIVPVCKSI